MFAVIVAAAGCGNSDGGFKAEGTVTIGGKPAKVTGCKQVKSKDFGRQTEFTLDTGHVIYWDIPAAIVRKDGKEVAVECGRDEIDAENGKGAWHATCSHPDGEIVLDLDFDC